MAKLKFIYILLFAPLATLAQLETAADWKRQVYDNEFTAGIMFHTRGFGANVRYLKYKDGFKKRGFDFDMVNIRHPKEIKIEQSNSNSSRGYVYGKLNGLFAIRAGYGRERILVDKTDQGSISISWMNFFGPSIGILKPIYLQVQKEATTGAMVITTERYDPEVHDYQQIYGQAPFFTGISKSKIRLGLYAKTGFAFDYNWKDEKITTLELGAVVDYYPSWFGAYKDEKVPIMYQAENYNIWLQFYVTVNFGQKWN